MIIVGKNMAAPSFWGRFFGGLFGTKRLTKTVSQKLIEVRPQRRAIQSMQKLL